MDKKRFRGLCFLFISIFLVVLQPPKDVWANQSQRNNTRKENIKKQVDENKQGMQRWINLEDYTKGRDFLVYAYHEQAITYDEFEKMMDELINSAENHGFSMPQLGAIMNNAGLRTQSNLDVVEGNAQVTMYAMWDTIPDKYKNETLANLNVTDDRYGLEKDIWYLCPYGCRELNSSNKWSKVEAWGYNCRETHISHMTVLENTHSFIRLTTEKGLSGDMVIQYKDKYVRRDCSSYVSCVLYNLGLDYMWESDPGSLGSRAISKLEEKVKASKDFIFLSYDEDVVRPGDIVAKQGHTEIFMGWEDKEQGLVYHYSWGSTTDVYNIKDNGPSGVYFNAYKQAKRDKSYKNSSAGKYIAIIRYVGQTKGEKT